MAVVNRRMSDGPASSEVGARIRLQVSQAMKALYDATAEMRVDQQVMTFTESDFSRTLHPMAVQASARTMPGQPSNDFGRGRQGRRSLRKFPTLALTGPDDANNGGRVGSLHVT